MMKKFFLGSGFILSIALMVSGIAIILSSKPIMNEISILAMDNRIWFAFLWLLLLMFCGAIGISLFFTGMLVTKYIIDEIKTPEDSQENEEKKEN